MLHPVWPNLDFWSVIWIISILPWFCSFTEMEFVKKSTHLIPISLSLFFSSCLCTFLLFKLSFWLRSNPESDPFFHGYQRAGKITGSALLFFGNIGLYYYSEKSVACVLTFLFLAFYCLCTLFCIQPCTDFGILEFLLSASLNISLSLFGLCFPSWLVLIACIFVAGLRYWLEPEQFHRVASSGTEENQLPLKIIASEPISWQSHGVANALIEENQLSIGVVPSEPTNSSEDFWIPVAAWEARKYKSEPLLPNGQSHRVASGLTEENN